MAAPTPGTRVATAFASSVTSMPVNMPATINSGDRLIAVVSVRNSGTFTRPTGWAELAGQVGGGAVGKTTVFEKIADGTEAGTTPGWTASTGTTAEWQVYRVTGAHASAASEVTTTSGDASAADPPAITPVNGSDDYLYIAVAGHAAVSAAAFTAAPTGYLSFQNDGASSGGSAVSIATAYKQTTASTTENPGTFTAGGSNRFWAAATIAVRPAASGSVVTKTQPATARIATNPTKTQSAVARVATNRTKTQAALSRIAVTVTKTQPAKARIAQNSTKTQTALARVQTNRSRTQPAISRIQVTAVATQPAVARVATNLTKTQSAVAKISNVTTRTATQTATARVQVGLTKTQPALARVQQSLTVTQTATARTSITGATTQPAVARIQVSPTKVQPATARIKMVVSLTQPATARVQTNQSATQSAVSRIATSPTRTQPATARVSVQRTKTQSATARIAVTGYVELPSTPLYYDIGGGLSIPLQKFGQIAFSNGAPTRAQDGYILCFDYLNNNLYVYNVSTSSWVKVAMA